MCVLTTMDLVITRVPDARMDTNSPSPSDKVHLELTTEQQQEIKAQTGEDVTSIARTAEELEERIAPVAQIGLGARRRALVAIIVISPSISDTIETAKELPTNVVISRFAHEHRH